RRASPLPSLPFASLFGSPLGLGVYLLGLFPASRLAPGTGAHSYAPGPCRRTRLSWLGPGMLRVGPAADLHGRIGSRTDAHHARRPEEHTPELHSLTHLVC